MAKLHSFTLILAQLTLRGRFQIMRSVPAVFYDIKSQKFVSPAVQYLPHSLSSTKKPSFQPIPPQHLAVKVFMDSNLTF